MPLLDHFHPPVSERRSWEGFHGLWAAALVEKLNRELRAVLEFPDIRSKLQTMGNEVRGASPDDMKDMVGSEISRWNQVISDAKISKQ